MSQRRPGQRRNQPSRSGSSFPWMWAGTILVVVLVVGALFMMTRQSTAQAETVECNRTEHLTYHVHTNLKVYVKGQAVPVSGNIGIRPDCLYWLHTHDASGTLHVEAPRPQNFTLGQFFKIWEKSLSPTEMMGYKVDDQNQIKVYVDGQEYTGDPAQIPLKARGLITLQYGPPFMPPHTHQFAPNE